LRLPFPKNEGDAVMKTRLKMTTTTMMMILLLLTTTVMKIW